MKKYCRNVLTTQKRGGVIIPIKTEGLKLACMGMWYDIDTYEDLEFLSSHLECLKAGGLDTAPKTFRFLKELKL